MIIELIQAVEADARAIHAMQVQAFQPLLDRYQDYDASPANEPVERVLERIVGPNGAFFRIVAGGEPVGAIRVVLRDGSHWISPLFVAPQHQGRGYARTAVRLAEARYAEARVWELVTLREETRNCRFYEQLGYRLTGAERKLNERATLVSYKKEV